MIYATPCSPRSSIRGRLGGTSWPSSSAARHIPSTYTAAHYTGRSARRSCAGHDAGISTRPGYATKRGARYPGGHGGRGTPAQPGRVYSRRSGLSGRRSWMIYATPCSPRSSIRGRLGGASWPSSSAAIHAPSTCPAAHYTGRSARRSCAGHDAGISTRPGYATKRGARYPGGFGRLGTHDQPGRVYSRRSGLSGRRSWLIYATPCSPRSSIRGRLGGTSWPSSSAARHIPSTYTAAHYTGRSARRSCAGHDAGISTRPGYATKRGARYPGGRGGRGTPAQPDACSAGHRSWIRHRVLLPPSSPVHLASRPLHRSWIRHRVLLPPSSPVHLASRPLHRS